MCRYMCRSVCAFYFRKLDEVVLIQVLITNILTTLIRIIEVVFFNLYYVPLSTK
ncbi:hypothetical protein T190607A01A_10881 [Tenacibaculum sp. 190524A05c]|uniref:Uncharacterized protein n=1 Tax=Tenacibaculum platacis TaxID=3137852 RepID=A0ABM9NUI6_9FLAO